MPEFSILWKNEGNSTKLSTEVWSSENCAKIEVIVTKKICFCNYTLCQWMKFIDQAKTSFTAIQWEYVLFCVVCRQLVTS